MGDIDGFFVIGMLVKLESNEGVGIDENFILVFHKDTDSCCSLYLLELDSHIA